MTPNVFICPLIHYNCQHWSLINFTDHFIVDQWSTSSSLDVYSNTDSINNDNDGLHRTSVSDVENYNESQEQLPNHTVHSYLSCHIWHKYKIQLFVNANNWNYFWMKDLYYSRMKNKNYFLNDK